MVDRPKNRVLGGRIQCIEIIQGLPGFDLWVREIQNFTVQETKIMSKKWIHENGFNFQDRSKRFTGWIPIPYKIVNS